jgi:hypothetical protein
MKQQTHHTPAYPTFPVTDKLGQIIVNFGSSKLEMGAFIIAAGVAQHVDNLLPETVADMAIEIARAIIDKCEDQLQEDTKPQQPQIIK